MRQVSAQCGNSYAGNLKLRANITKKNVIITLPQPRINSGYVKNINKLAVQGSRRVDLMFKQASLKGFTSDFDVCDKDLGIDSVSSATCIESN